MGNQEGIFERVDKNGKPLWLEAEYTPIVDSTGKVVQVVKNARNLTAQVEAETRLAEVTASLESKIRAGEQAISGVNEQISEVLEKNTHFKTSIESLSGWDMATGSLNPPSAPARNRTAGREHMSFGTGCVRRPFSGNAPGI